MGAWPAPPWPPPQRPAGPSVGWAIGLWCMAAAGLAAALLCGLISAAGFWTDNHMDNEGVTTTATVREVTSSLAAIEFLTEDGE